MGDFAVASVRLAFRKGKLLCAAREGPRRLFSGRAAVHGGHSAGPICFSCRARAFLQKGLDLLLFLRSGVASTSSLAQKLMRGAK